MSEMCYLACAYRTPSGYCGSTGGAATCPHRQRKYTNADRIRHMSDEELADYLSVIDSSRRPCYSRLDKEEWLNYLREEIKE